MDKLIDDEKVMFEKIRRMSETGMGTVSNVNNKRCLICSKNIFFRIREVVKSWIKYKYKGTYLKKLFVEYNRI